jgi:hypothetical protein
MENNVLFLIRQTSSDCLNMGVAMVHQTEKQKMITGQVYRSGGVTRNVPANVLAAGNPCKVIRNLADV